MRVTAAAAIREDPTAFGRDVAQTHADTPRTRRHKPRRTNRESPLRVALAIPHDCTRAKTQAGWLDDVQQHPALTQRRNDAQTNILAVAEVLARAADFEHWTTRPGWHDIITRTGLSRTSVATHIAWLRRHKLLGLVSPGTTPRFSPGILRPKGQEERNDAAVYVLTAPHHLRLIAVTHPEDHGYEYEHDGRDQPDDHGYDGYEHEPTTHHHPTFDPTDTPLHQHTNPPVDESRTPTPSGGGKEPPACARATQNPQNHPHLGKWGLEEQMRTGLRPDQPSKPNHGSPADTMPGQPLWPVTSTPQGRQERALAAATLQALNPVFTRISTPFVASLLREWHLAGWTVNDIRHALDHRPDGTPWTHETDIRHIPGWTRHRLAAWRDTNATPTTSPTRRQATTRTETTRRIAAAQAAQATIETTPTTVLDTLGPIVTTRRLNTHTNRTTPPEPTTDTPAESNTNPTRHPAIADQLALIRARNTARRHPNRP